jgi:hypothetical protein
LITQPGKPASGMAIHAYGICCTISPAESLADPTVGLLDAMPHRRRLYADNAATIHTAAC